ncbi:hypothetical protein LOAG_15404 [Loa loa]|nr:hypothetical protein LOAG_15404 [Loa loa]EFO13126.1 hypothetical protein LOAG_15404 [Loa loa]
MPKFTSRNKRYLTSALKKMGMRSMFERTADFSGISNQKSPTFIDVLNVAHIKINEKGINNENSSIPVNNVVTIGDGEQFVADHPFLYVIINNRETILWMGRFAPTEKDLIVGNLAKVVENKEVPRKREK